jgi:hypothetical protein
MQYPQMDTDRAWFMHMYTNGRKIKKWERTKICPIFGEIARHYHGFIDRWIEEEGK